MSGVMAWPPPFPLQFSLAHQSAARVLAARQAAETVLVLEGHLVRVATTCTPTRAPSRHTSLVLEDINPRIHVQYQIPNLGMRTSCDEEDASKSRTSANAIPRFDSSAVNQEQQEMLRSSKRRVSCSCKHTADQTHVV